MYGAQKHTQYYIYNNLCTRLLYQHQILRAYKSSKNMLWKKLERLTKQLDKTKVETLHLMSTDFIKFPMEILYGIKNDIPSIIKIYLVLFLLGKSH